VLNVTLNLEGVKVVGAFRFLIGNGGQEAPTFVFIVEAEERGDAIREGVVGLIGEFVAVGDGVEGGKDELRLAGGGIAVGSAKGDCVAVVHDFGDAIGADDVNSLAGGGELFDLFAFPSDAVAGEVVPVPCQDIFDAETGVEILVGLFAGGRDAVDVVRTRQTGGGDGVAERKAGLSIGEDAVADAGRFRSGVVLVERRALEVLKRLKAAR